MNYTNHQVREVDAAILATEIEVEDSERELIRTMAEPARSDGGGYFRSVLNRAMQAKGKLENLRLRKRKFMQSLKSSYRVASEI